MKIEHLAMDVEQRRLERAVMRAAATLYDHQTEVMAGRGAWPDGDLLPGVVLRDATAQLAEYHGSTTHLLADLDQEEDYAVDLQWITRTWADVRRGDTVRLPGTDVTAKISDRYIPPAADEKAARGERNGWHIAAGLTGHWDDRVVRPGECWVVFEGETKPRNMDSAKPVEIQLSADEIQAIEAIGWDNRLELK